MIPMSSYLLVSIIRYWAVIHLPHEKAHSPDGPCAMLYLLVVVLTLR